MEEKRLLLAGLSQVPQVGNIKFKEVVGDLDKLPYSRDKLLREGERFLNRVIGNPIFFGEEKYPYFLSQISDPPKYIFVDGDRDLVDWYRTVSIVGTRTPSEYGRYMAAYLGNQFGKLSVSVVSGLAYGVDRISQYACAKAKTPTVGVLGEGINSWKKSNKKIHDQFKGNLLLISEYEGHMPARKHTFPERNRIIAGLTGTTIVVEAKERSGALITAKFASQYVREVYAVPHPLSSSKGKGCNDLIYSNEAQILKDIKDVLSCISSYSSVGNVFSKQIVQDKIDEQIINLIRNSDGLLINDIAANLNENSSELIPRLTKLESTGILTRSIENRYKLSTELL